ncbi:MAG: sigma-54-dependent transcriptional regulator, partial [Spirochaetota bacterium]
MFSENSSILIVDDDKFARMFFRDVIGAARYRVDEAENGREALEKIKNNVYDVVITDLRMGKVGGIDVLKAARAQVYEPEVLIVTAYGTIESAVEAVKQGAFDFITKPLSAKKVTITLQRALEKNKLTKEVKHLRQELKEKFGNDSIIAESPSMRKIMHLVDMVSATDSTVLIEGESGTGKELVAKAIHYRGNRAGKPFLAVNCAAVPEPLLESELFGHVKGSFSGAVGNKKGIFKEADGGTLLLDEISEMPRALQVKLLRVLQEGEVRMVGSNIPGAVNVRIIASSNRNIPGLVQEGLFREDLYYRLNVIPISIPPLRERKKDIVPLANFFLRKYCTKLNRPVKQLSPEVLERILNCEWPGNIR